MKYSRVVGIMPVSEPADSPHAASAVPRSSAAEFKAILRSLGGAAPAGAIDGRRAPHLQEDTLTALGRKVFGVEE